ncbi:hypothetical protein [Chitinophaga costaii]|uniref:hypothetical protein n=1 Tax=Chitinophaga costaii TaxID=1335309 RepID=UPI000F5092DC|nr:hypothetical protein [Chitinophaga costaii]
MRKLSLFIILLYLLNHQSGKAHHQPAKAALLRLAANGQQNLLICARKDLPVRYENMALLDKTHKALTWFTRYG